METVCVNGRRKGAWFANSERNQSPIDAVYVENRVKSRVAQKMCEKMQLRSRWRRVRISTFRCFRVNSVLFRFRRLCAGALRERVNTTRTSIAGRDLSGEVGSGFVTEKKRSPRDKKEEEKMKVNDSGSATVGKQWNTRKEVCDHQQWRNRGLLKRDGTKQKIFRISVLNTWIFNRDIYFILSSPELVHF